MYPRDERPARSNSTLSLHGWVRLNVCELVQGYCGCPSGNLLAKSTTRESMIPQAGKHVSIEVSCNLEQWMIRYAIYLALGLLSTVPRSTNRVIHTASVRGCQQRLLSCQVLRPGNSSLRSFRDLSLTGLVHGSRW